MKRSNVKHTPPGLEQWAMKNRRYIGQEDHIWVVEDIISHIRNHLWNNATDIQLAKSDIEHIETELDKAIKRIGQLEKKHD